MSSFVSPAQVLDLGVVLNFLDRSGILASGFAGSSMGAFTNSDIMWRILGKLGELIWIGKARGRGRRGAGDFRKKGGQCNSGSVLWLMCS
jgi:hypothetical protein